MTPELLNLSMLELSTKLARRETSSVEVVRACLGRIEQVDGKLKAFLRVDAKGALAAAESSDARRKSNAALGPLDGVPVGLKDMFLTEGVETTAGSKILAGFIPPYDATAVELLKGAGLPIIGKHPA